MKTILSIFLILSLCGIGYAQTPWYLAEHLIHPNTYEKCFSRIEDRLEIEGPENSYEKSDEAYDLLRKSLVPPVQLIPDGSPNFDSLKSFFERHDVHELVYQYDYDSPLKTYTFQPHKYAFTCRYNKVYKTFIFSDHDPSSNGFYVTDSIWYEDEFSPASEVKAKLHIEDFIFHPSRLFTVLEADRLKNEFDTAIFNPDGSLQLLAKQSSPEMFVDKKAYDAYAKNYMDSIHKLTDNKLYFREFFLRKKNFSEEQLKAIWKHLKKINEPPHSYSDYHEMHLETLRITRSENYTRVTCKRFRIKGKKIDLINQQSYYFDSEGVFSNYSKFNCFYGKDLTDSVALFRNEKNNITRMEHFYARSTYEQSYVHITQFEYKESQQFEKITVCGMNADILPNNSYSCANTFSCEPIVEYQFDSNGNITLIKRKSNEYRIQYTEFHRPLIVAQYYQEKETQKPGLLYEFIYKDTLLQKVQVMHDVTCITDLKPDPENECYFVLNESGKIIGNDLFVLNYSKNNNLESEFSSTTFVYGYSKSAIMKMTKSVINYNHDEHGFPLNPTSARYIKLHFTYNK